MHGEIPKTEQGGEVSPMRGQLQRLAAVMRPNTTRPIWVRRTDGEWAYLLRHLADAARFGAHEEMQMRHFIAAVLLAACGAAGAADCYVSHCRTDNDGTLWCDNQEIDCCHLRSFQCEPQPRYSHAGRDEGSTRIECSTPQGHPVEIVIRNEPVEVSPEWKRGGFEGHGNYTGYWGNGGHYQAYRLAPDMVNEDWY